MTDQTAHQPLTDRQLDEIDARRQAATDGPWDRYEEYGPTFFANVSGEYLRGVGDFNFGEGEQANADEAFVRHAREDIDLLVAEVRRLRARLWELERPSTEAERNALRQSFTELIAQASQDHDHEGAFDLECQLRDREEQWKREDAPVAAVVSSAAEPGSAR